MVFDAEILKVAKLYIQKTYDFFDYLDGKACEDVKNISNEIVATLEKSLTNEDRKKFKPIAQVILRDAVENPPDIAIAKAKFESLLNGASGKIRAESYISNNFENSILLNKFPELKKNMDGDGLLPVSVFDEVLSDAYGYKGFVFYPTTNYELTKSLLKITEKEIGSLKIRISHYSIIPRNEYFPTLREAHVWGKPFDPSMVYGRLFKANLTAVYERHPKTDFEKNYQQLMAKVVRFEANRHEDGNRIVISAETLIPIEETHENAGYVKTILFHSDVLIGQQRFNHIDVSCLVYTIEQYKQRLLVNMPVKIKAAGHHKLFWLGAGDISTWTELIQRTYPSNELVQEYLTGEDWSLDDFLKP